VWGDDHAGVRGRRRMCYHPSPRFHYRVDDHDTGGRTEPHAQLVRCRVGRSSCRPQNLGDKEDGECCVLRWLRAAFEGLAVRRCRLIDAIAPCVR
jgi:hypothetical protein